MMAKTYSKAIYLLAVFTFLAGCGEGNRDEHVKDLRDRVRNLQSQVDDLQMDKKNLQSEMAKSEQIQRDVKLLLQESKQILAETRRKSSTRPTAQLRQATRPGSSARRNRPSPSSNKQGVNDVQKIKTLLSGMMHRHSVTDIAKMLNQRNLKTEAGKPWSKEEVVKAFQKYQIRRSRSSFPSRIPAKKASVVKPNP